VDEKEGLMSRFRKLRPSPAMVVAVVALSLSLSGVAWALGTGVVTSQNIKDETIKSVDMKNGAGVKGVDVVNKSLSDADIAGLKIIPLKKVTPSATNADQDTARANATKIPLFSQGPFSIYAKCFKENSDPSNPGVIGEIYIKTTAGGAVFSSRNEDSSGNFFLAPSTPEVDRQLDTRYSYHGTDPGTLNITDPNQFYAAGGTTVLYGTTLVGTKVGNPSWGNGLFGTGDHCIFGGTILSK
jgi:hypothetical protein